MGVAAVKHRGLELTGDVLTFQGVELCRLSDTKLSASLAGDLADLINVLTSPLGGMQADEVHELFKDARHFREIEELEDEGDDD